MITAQVPSWIYQGFPYNLPYPAMLKFVSQGLNQWERNRSCHDYVIKQIYTEFIIHYRSGKQHHDAEIDGHEKQIRSSPGMAGF